MGEGRREGVDGELLPSCGRRRTCQREDGDSREGIFSLGSVPVHSAGIPALTLGMPRVHLPVVQRQGRDAQAWGGRDPEGVATAGAWRNLARGSGF